MALSLFLSLSRLLLWRNSKSFGMFRVVRYRAGTGAIYDQTSYAASAGLSTGQHSFRKTRRMNHTLFIDAGDPPQPVNLLRVVKSAVGTTVSDAQRLKRAGLQESNSAL